MASSKKTPLGLNQWADSDKPRMEDFNADNLLLDAELTKKASIGKPKEYDLPLESGIVRYEGGCKYFKTPNDVVTVLFHIRGESDNNFADRVIATLPVGFRPSYAIWTVVAGTSSGSDVTARLRITTDGKILIRASTTQLGGAMGQATFVAGN